MIAFFFLYNFWLKAPYKTVELSFDILIKTITSEMRFLKKFVLIPNTRNFFYLQFHKE